jgi:hypothetical protein
MAEGRGCGHGCWVGSADVTLQLGGLFGRARPGGSLVQNEELESSLRRAERRKDSGNLFVDMASMP